MGDKKKEYLVCIDSDGCAINSMKIKHTECFGPALVEVWGLENRETEVLHKWNEINLYSMTRGINRFVGLAKILKDLNVETEAALEALVRWTEHAQELSNASLMETCRRYKDPVLQKSMRWSLLVNEKIEALPISLPFFPVKGCVEQIHRKADISVVSSANREAITEEWRSGGLLQYVDYFFSQSDGSKQECIRKMTRQGYQNTHILMVGDAPGDYQAAASNGAWYYPILAGNEVESWEQLGRYFDLFIRDGFSEAMQRELIGEMEKNLRAGALP